MSSPFSFFLYNAITQSKSFIKNKKNMISLMLAYSITMRNASTNSDVDVELSPNNVFVKDQNVAHLGLPLLKGIDMVAFVLALVFSDSPTFVASFMGPVEQTNGKDLASFMYEDVFQGRAEHILAVDCHIPLANPDGTPILNSDGSQKHVHMCYGLVFQRGGPSDFRPQYFLSHKDPMIKFFNFDVSSGGTVPQEFLEHAASILALARDHEDIYYHRRGVDYSYFVAELFLYGKHRS